NWDRYSQDHHENVITRQALEILNDFDNYLEKASLIKGAKPKIKKLATDAERAQELVEKVALKWLKTIRNEQYIYDELGRSLFFDTKEIFITMEHLVEIKLYIQMWTSNFQEKSEKKPS
ncbi:MAG: hypothetical protein P0S94_02750, partial [Simkaniaceae bacterium]|nr:hypothetical protein [Simkaniaceae bacterium]